jgi:hypothetical protein
MVSARRIAHRLAGVTFLAALVVTFVGGLLWALSPEVSTGFTIIDGGAPAPRPPTVEPGGGSDAGAAPTPTPTPTPTTEATPDTDELIATARDPQDTTVQVLDAGAGTARTGAAADRLAEELGYAVVNVTSARVHVTETTVWFTDGNEAEAEALRARHPVVRVVAANRGLNEATDLHVLVGPDWQD